MPIFSIRNCLWAVLIFLILAPLASQSQEGTTAENRGISFRSADIKVPLKKQVQDKPARKSIVEKIISRKFYIDSKNISIIRSLKRYDAEIIPYNNKSLIIINNKILATIPKRILKTLSPAKAENILHLPFTQINTAAIRTNKRIIMRSDSNSSSLYMLQYKGKIKNTWRSSFHKGKIKIVRSMKRNALLVWATYAQLKKLIDSEHGGKIQFISPYKNNFKISPEIFKRKEDVVDVTFSIYIHDKSNESTQVIIRLAKKQNHTQWVSGNTIHIRTKVAKSDINVIAALPDVLSIHVNNYESLSGERQAITAAGLLVDGSGITIELNNGAPPTTTTVIPSIARQPADASNTGYLNWLNSVIPSPDTKFSTFLIDFTDSGIDDGSINALTINADLTDRDPTTPASRVIYQRRINGATSTDSTPAANENHNNHGTSVASIAAGLNIAALGSSTEIVDSNGFHFGMGISPYSRIGSTKLFYWNAANSRTERFDPLPDFISLYASAYAADPTAPAIIFNNSWGDLYTTPAGTTYATWGQYDNYSITYDRLVRDSSTGAGSVAGNQQSVIIFSAGNTGFVNDTLDAAGDFIYVPSSNPDTSWQYSSLWNKGATAKNTIVVGASENTGINRDADAGCATHDEATNDWADNTQDTTYFSSRGPTLDGRFKPDLVAPGIRTQSVRSSNLEPALVSGICDHPSITSTSYVRDMGTSMAAPVVAGAAALLQQWFIDRASETNYNNIETNVSLPISNPSPALTKGWLMNSTTYLNRPGAESTFYPYAFGISVQDPIAANTDNLPSNVQGMGQLNTGRALDSNNRIFRDQSHVFTGDTSEMPATTTNRDYIVRGTINNVNEIFRVTLSWTDYAEAGNEITIRPSDGVVPTSSLNNDLDLIVCVGASDLACTGGIEYRGNHFNQDVSQPLTVVGGITCGAALENRDCANNVESIWLPANPALINTNFVIRVRPINVQDGAVTLTNGVPEQDFALIVYNADVAVSNDSFPNGTVTTVTDDASTSNITSALLENDQHEFIDNGSMSAVGSGLYITGINTANITDSRINVSFIPDPGSDPYLNAVTFFIDDGYANGETPAITQTFTYTVSDGYGSTNTATATLNVTGSNDPPTAVDDAINATEDTMFTSVIDLDANDLDIDGDSLTVVAGSFTTTQAGTLVLAANGSYTYLSASNFNGVDSVDYTVTDGSLTDTATLTITVAPIDDAPIATNETTCVLPSSSVDINLTGIDFIDSETVNIVAVDLTGSHPTRAGAITTGTLPIASPSMVTYTPHPDAANDPLLTAAYQDSFMFSINEAGHVDTAVTGTITVNVTRGCRQPVDITLVLDTSGSMRQVVPGGTQTKMELLRSSVQMFSDVWAANTVAPNLIGTDRVGLTYFHSTAQQYMPSLEAITTANVLSNLNEDICDPDAVMVCQRTGSGATAMGAGLQEAYSLLTGGAGTNSFNTNKFIILFTDGMQNRNPMVNDPAGATPIEISDVSGRNPADTSVAYPPVSLQADFKDSNNITIHSIGLGTPGTGSFYDTLQEISNSSNPSTAGTLQITNDATGQLPDIWLNVLVDSLSGSTLEMVGHDEGIFTRNDMRQGKKHSYHLNKTARTATFVLYWQGEQRKDALQFALRHKKSGTLIPAGTLGQKTIKKDFYTIKHLEFPLRLPNGTVITADSEWEMLINGRLSVKSVNYQTWSMVDDNGVNYRFNIPSKAFRLGEKININAAITNKQGKNIIKKIISADVTVLSPRQGIGTFTSINTMARKPNNASITGTLAAPLSQPQLDPDSFRNAADKKLFLLLQNPELRKQLVPIKTILPLDTTPNNNAKRVFTSTTVPGVYTLRINVMGLAADGSTIQRTRRFSTVVRMVNISPSKSKVVVKRTQIKKGNLQVVLTPIDKYGNYLGPGRAKAIQLSSTNIEKVGALTDNLDGSYTQNFISKSLFGTPIKLKVLDTEFVVDTSIDPRVYWLIIFILLLLAIFGLYRYFKK